MVLPGRTTLSKFLIEQLQEDHAQLAALLVDVAAAIKAVAAMTAKGALGGNWTRLQGGASDAPMKLDVMAHEEVVRSCEWGGLVAGMVSAKALAPHEIPPDYKRGRYLLLFDPLGGTQNFELNMPIGTLFSVFEHRGTLPPGPADYLKPGRDQVAAGYAIYGPATMLVLTVGKGTHGFTLDREIGNFVLTHPELRIPADTSEFAVNTSNERFWEPPVQRYVRECKAGSTDIRARDFTMRWIASHVADVHRILMRGGMFMSPRDMHAPERRGRISLLFTASPLAFLVEQAQGHASTGRERILDVTPEALDEPIPMFLGSAHEVERIERYHRDYDQGADEPYVSPLFNERSLFRDTSASRR
ncbi:MAG TPA: class 1 fructose-bisphosphatase [Candidatus Binatia bacterium]|nr:class 1 fructose-bisphosphatase [Candidatus Binatia bacterium]